MLPEFLRSAFARAGTAPRDGGGKALDFKSPKDNLYAFGKLWAGYDAPVVGAFHGLMFAMIGTQRLQLLFGSCGFGIFESRLESDAPKRQTGGQWAPIRPI